MKRDALGRAIKDSISYVSKQTPQKIKVVVDYENLNHLYKTGFSGRYEISSNGREKKFWLNGKLLQEDAYFIEFKKNLAKQSEEVSPYRPPRVEYLTAEEIENLINGAGIVSIVEYKEPEMLSNDTTVGGIVYLADSLIRVQSQIQTNAFPLEYKLDIDYDTQFEKTILSFCNKVMEIVGYQPVTAALTYSDELF